MKWQKQTFLVESGDTSFFKDLIIEDKWRGLSIVFKPQENIYSIYHMSRSSVKYGEMPPRLHLQIFPWKIIYLVALPLSPQARKGPTGDCLMIAGSCIKYTAAAGERGEHIQSGFWCWGEAWVQTVRKTQNVWVPWLGLKLLMDAWGKGLNSKWINILKTDLRMSVFWLDNCIKICR